jgi:putative chitinase
MDKRFFVVIALILFLLFRKRIINENAKFVNIPNYMRDNAKIVFDALTSQGYNNPYALSAMLATIERESNFIPKTELSYKNTSAFRIKKIFSSKLGQFSDAYVDNLKQDDVKFFGAVYGGRYGNNTAGDGYKYRGRGFNQITFKDTYKQVGDKIGFDLVSNPDELNRVSVATKALIVFWEDKIKDAMKSGKWEQNFNNDLNHAQNQEEANKMLLKINGGWNLGYETEQFKFLQIHAPSYFDLITDP